MTINYTEIKQKFSSQNCLYITLTVFSDILIFVFLAISCPILKPPGNGTLDCSGNKLGDAARYSCNRGFIISGSERRTCQQTGKWSGIQPTCHRKKLLFSYCFTIKCACYLCYIEICNPKFTRDNILEKVHPQTYK